jgi:hypothetical protein
MVSIGYGEMHSCHIEAKRREVRRCIRGKASKKIGAGIAVNWLRAIGPFDKFISPIGPVEQFGTFVRTNDKNSVMASARAD